ncbi:ParB/RepB/Spo0J family partition protein [Polaromonas sp. P1(28)-13]|nr:ParB/RepB/Spo0J family partition protein [Polaromonas sp. P1(28)-13]
MTSPSGQSTIAPGLLKPNPWNTNHVSSENEAKIDVSVKRFGMFKPVLVRELPDGTLQIIGGQHRVESAIRLKLPTVPYHNLGVISDNKAKEIGLVDNGRYGADDVLQLAELLEGLGGIDDIAAFMPYSDTELTSIFSSVNIELDDLDLPDDDGAPSAPAVRLIQTHSVMRFKVPSGDVATITERIDKVMKDQRFTEEDSLSNAGNALVHIFKKAEA